MWWVEPGRRRVKLTTPAVLACFLLQLRTTPGMKGSHGERFKNEPWALN